VKIGIKLDVKVIVWEGVAWIHWLCSRVIWTWCCNFGFHERWISLLFEWPLFLKKDCSLEWVSCP